MTLKETEPIAALSPEVFWSRFVKPRIAQTLGVSHRDKPILVMQARQTIDAELAAMHLAMCSLRSRHNALIPIFGLPPEVLTRIFGLCAALEPPATFDLGWIRVTHICRAWRDAALHDPSLWSDITDCIGLKWVNIMLARSKAVPISYYQESGVPDDDAEPAKVVLPAQLHRLRHLSLSVFMEGMSSIFLMLTSPAPVIECLELREASEGMGMVMSLPIIAFEGHTPKLRRLLLSNVRIPWSSPILSRLTHLHIEFFSDVADLEWEADSFVNDGRTDTGLAGYNNFFRALEKMPVLETLKLSRGLPEKPFDGADDHTVSLPCLNALQLLGTSSEIRDILARLDIPVLCALFFQSETRRGRPPAPVMEDYLPFLRLQNRHSEAQIPMRAFSLHFDDGSGGFSFWRTCQISPTDTAVYRAENKADITLFLPHPARFSIGPLRSLFEAVPVDALRVLIVDENAWTTSWSTQDWIEGFRRCSAVEQILVSGMHAVGFCRALATPLDSQAAEKQEDEGIKLLTLDQLFLPSLRLLELEHVDFRIRCLLSDQTENDEDTSDVDSDDRLWGEDGAWFSEALTSWLGMRSAGGGPPLTLAITGCEIDRECVYALREVAEVKWDNYEGHVPW